MNKQCALVLLSTAFLVISFCSKQTIKQTVVVQKGHEVVTVEKKDTTGYIISFGDSSERMRFINSFEKMIKQMPSERIAGNSDKFVHIKIAAPIKTPLEIKPVVGETLTTVPKVSAPFSSQKTEPKFGGAATVYSQREFLDQTMAVLCNAYPFSKSTCNETVPKDVAGLLDAKLVSDKQLDLSIKGNLISATGQNYSAFDLVNIWSAFIKKHPAEGLALFKNVKGIDGYIAGKETIVSGFTVSSEKTVSLHFDKADPNTMARVCTRRLFPASFKMGPYFLKNDNGQTLLLAANPKSDAPKPLLSSCAIKLGKDPTPLIAFSLNRYDAVTLFSAKDLEFARRKANDKSDLIVFSESRYFVSCMLLAKEMRAACKKLIAAKEILSEFVRADGTVLSCLECETAEDGSVPTGSPQLQALPPGTSTVAILYRVDDPVSKIIAEKILADFSRAGLQCSLKGATCEEYEASLVRKDYGIAIGWVEKNIVSDASEKLRLASMWFNDNTDEKARLDDIREIPLFSIKTYLLCKKKISFYGDAFEGMFISE